MVWYIKHCFFKKGHEHTWYFCGSHCNQGDIILSKQATFSLLFVLFLVLYPLVSFGGTFQYSIQSITPKLLSPFWAVGL